MVFFQAAVVFPISSVQSVPRLGVTDLTLFAHFITHLGDAERARPCRQATGRSQFGPSILGIHLHPSPSKCPKSPSSEAPTLQNHSAIGDWLGGTFKCSKKHQNITSGEEFLMGICGYLQWGSPHFWTSCLNFRSRKEGSWA